MIRRIGIDIPTSEIAGFCKRWKVVELSLFGSVLHEAFAPDSDVDVLVTFEPQARWTLLDLVEMEDELSAVLGREVDIVTRKAIERSRNPYRKSAILDSARTIYVAR